MDRDSIISDLFRSKDFNDCIRKMEPKHLQDDLRAEVMLILCEMPEEFLIETRAKSELDLKRFVVRIIMNQIKSITSPFYKQYRSDNVRVCADLLEDIAIDEGLTRKGRSFNAELLNDNESDVIEFQVRLEEERKNELRMMEVYAMMPFNHYAMNLFLIYLKLGNYRAIERETKIPTGSAFKTIKQAIKKIDEAVNMRTKRAQPYDLNELMDYIQRADRQEAIDYLYNVLDYYKKEYPEDLGRIVRAKAKEKEARFNNSPVRAQVA